MTTSTDDHPAAAAGTQSQYERDTAVAPLVVESMPALQRRLTADDGELPTDAFADTSEAEAEAEAEAGWPNFADLWFERG